VQFLKNIEVHIFKGIYY